MLKRGAGRITYFNQVFTEQFSSQPCGLNDGVQGSAVLIWNIKSARPPCVDRPPASKRGVRQTLRSDVPQQHTCTNIGRCVETGLPASTINLQACRCLGQRKKEKKTGANTETFLSDAEHICRLSEVTRESTDSALKNIKLALKNQPRGRRVPVGWDPLQGLIHLHITLSVLSLSCAPRRHPSLPRCAAVYVEMGYDRSWTEAPQLQHEQMRSPNFTHSRFISCLQPDKYFKSLDSGVEPSSQWVRGRNTPRSGVVTSPLQDTHTQFSHTSGLFKLTAQSVVVFGLWQKTVKSPSRIKPYYQMPTVLIQLLMTIFTYPA